MSVLQWIIHNPKIVSNIKDATVVVLITVGLWLLLHFGTLFLVMKEAAERHGGFFT